MSFQPGTLADPALYDEEAYTESWTPPPLPQPPSSDPQLSYPPQPPQPLRAGSPRTAEAPSDQARMAELLAAMPREDKRSMRQRASDAYTNAVRRGVEMVAPAIPPELRGKVSAAGEFIDASNPATQLASYARNAGRGNYLAAAGDLASIIPIGPLRGAAPFVRGALGSVVDPRLYSRAGERQVIPWLKAQ